MLVVLLALASWSVGQEESATSSTGVTTISASTAAATTNSASTTSSGPMTHTVLVAKAGFTFQPDVTLANVGDVIEFDFYPTNHSVIRFQYGYPCIPYEDTGVDLIGFFSGFEPVDAILAEPPKWSVTVNNTDPIFFYCGATGACLNYGMVGVINPNASTNIETQKALALNSTFMLLPGQTWPSEDQDPFTTASTVASATTLTSTSISISSPATLVPTSSPTPAPSSSHLSSGAIAGITIGAAFVGVLAAGFLYKCGRQSRRAVPHLNPHYSNLHSPAMATYTHPDNTKHISVANTSMVLPALPGYVPQHDVATSLPLSHSYLSHSYLASETLGLVSHDALRRSQNTSPLISEEFGAPAYESRMPPQRHSDVRDSSLPRGVHEMPGSADDSSASNGILVHQKE